jgi:hypothetical protein
MYKDSELVSEALRGGAAGFVPSKLRVSRS